MQRSRIAAVVAGMAAQTAIIAGAQTPATAPPPAPQATLRHSQLPPLLPRAGRTDSSFNPPTATTGSFWG